MFQWTEKSAAVLQQGGVVAPDERLPWPQTAAMGVQHVIAMFGATVLAPILMGFDPNVCILMSGIGTLLFFLVTNFGVWALGTMYPNTFAGLLACYVAAVPFFGNTLLGDAAYTVVLFGGLALAEKWLPALREPLPEFSGQTSQMGT